MHVHACVCMCAYATGYMDMYRSLNYSDILSHLLQVQIILLIILLVAIADFLIGTFLPRAADSQASLRGVTGYRRMNGMLCRSRYTLIILCTCTLLTC